jgi:hypothetical protein
LDDHGAIHGRINITITITIICTRWRRSFGEEGTEVDDWDSNHLGRKKMRAFMERPNIDEGHFLQP